MLKSNREYSLNQNMVYRIMGKPCWTRTQTL